MADVINNEILNNKKVGFFNGFTSVFDLTGQSLIPHIDSETPGWIQDGNAIRGDWLNIGNDMRKAMDIYANGQQ